MIFYNVFSGNLSGKFREYFVKNSEGKIFNNLHSYWYFKNLPDEKILEAFELTKGNIMIDSGAFTAWSKNIEIDVDKYIDWINKWDKYVTLFGQIDVIPKPTANTSELDDCCQKTWDNFLYMYNRLNNPQKLLYTFHCGEDFKWLKQAMEFRDSQGRALDYIAIGGLVGKPTAVRDAFLTGAFRVIQNSSNPNVKVHGFGVSSASLWSKYPFESCDSFTAGVNANHGFAYKPGGGTYRGDNYKDMFKPNLNKENISLLKEETYNQEIEDISLNDDINISDEDANKRADMKTKLLVSNIEFWTEKAKSISKPSISKNMGLFPELY